ncbi:MAG: ABC transporter permease [Lachnospiraceae bacterium]|nr:ABC transporter permease [Lachnospiraceae bacterium]
MKQFMVICNIEFRLFTREFFGFFFTLVFPILMLLLFGGIYGDEPIYHGADAKIMDISVPAYSVMIIGVTGLMSLPLTLSNCIEKKIYKRFDATPAGKKSIICAQVFVNLIMTFIGISILIITGKILYHIQIKGTFLFISIGLLFSTAAMFSIGFLFTAVGRDLKSTNLLCYLCYFIMLFLSGATIPDMLFTNTIKKISNLLPMTHAVDLMQGVFAGENLLQHGTELFILGASTIICTAAGAILYRKKDWT